MRGRHALPGARNDLNAKLGLPKRAGWEDYLRSRGLRPDTVRNWFRKYTALSTLSFLVSGTVAPSRTLTTKLVKNPPQLYKVATRSRTFMVAATSAGDALAAVGRVAGASISENPSVKAVELGAVIEVSASGGFEQVLPVQSRPALPPHPSPEAYETEPDRADLDLAIMRALKKSPGVKHSVLAKRFRVTAVTVRRVAMRHKLHINPPAEMVSKSAPVNANN